MRSIFATHPFHSQEPRTHFRCKTGARPAIAAAVGARTELLLRPESASSAMELVLKFDWDSSKKTTKIKIIN